MTRRSCLKRRSGTKRQSADEETASEQVESDGTLPLRLEENQDARDNALAIVVEDRLSDTGICCARFPPSAGRSTGKCSPSSTAEDRQINKCRIAARLSLRESGVAFAERKATIYFAPIPRHSERITLTLLL